jgi:tRNA-Thr(GGU) m(6)t(6)A37 methyltransferase TsaA
MTFTLVPVAFVTSTRQEPIDDDWGAVEASITLSEGCSPDSLRGLEEFSHIEVIFVFDQVDPATVTTGARRPRGNPAWPDVGIFAQRAKNRPNRLGLSTCEVLAVDGDTIRVRGLDAIDGTPVLDIKPYLTEFQPRTQVTQPAWSRELMANYF